MSRNRIRTRNRSRKLRKDSKTIPIWGSPDRGDGEDHGRYWECWHCGMVCDADRDELGDSESSAPTEPTAYTLTDDVGNTTGYCSGKTGATQTLCEAAGGTWVTERYKDGGGGGCPFCHSLNYRGDY